MSDEMATTADPATCTSCHHVHQGRDLAYICIGCPCPLTPGKIADAIAEATPKLATPDPNGGPEWLARACPIDTYRGELKRPFPLEYEGVRYAVATDGRFLIAVRGDFAMQEARGIAASVSAIFGTPPTHTLVPFARFLAWASAGKTPPPAGPCPQCNDTKVAKCDECRGEGSVECTCETCDDVHDAECDECGGKKTVACACVPPPALVPGVVARKVVNRALFGPFVEHLAPVAEVKVGTIADQPTPIFFWCDEWRVIVMPMNPNRVTDEERQSECL